MQMESCFQTHFYFGILMPQFLFFQHPLVISWHKERMLIRIVFWSNSEEQAKLNGEAFITKLQFLKNNYKSNIENVIDKIYRLEKEIVEIEKLEHQEKINQVLNRLTNEGLVFEFSKAFDVSAKSAISTNYVKATLNEGKKTYSLEYKILDKVFVVDRVKEMYIRSIAERVVAGLK